LTASILPLDDQALRTPSQPVAPDDPALEAHMRDLASALATFRAANGWGRAVALPQLGVAKRLVVLDLGSGPGFVINPVVLWTSPELFEVWDDCMCAPDIAVRVLRHRSMTVRFETEQGLTRTIERAPEEVSELLQHELDHLDGVLMTDRRIAGAIDLPRSVARGGVGQV
jgi:peptide deformylase